MLLKNHQQSTFKVNSKCQLLKILKPQAILNLLVFLFRSIFISLFLGTEITANNKTSRNALQKDCCLNV